MLIDIKQWTMLFTIAVLTAGIISNLLPDGKISAAAKTSLSFFLLACLIIPLRDVTFDFPLQMEESILKTQQWQEKFELQTSQLSYSLAKEHILKLVQTKLELMGLQVLGLDIKFLEKEMGIQLQLTISLPEKEKEYEGTIRKKIFSEFGIQDIEFIWREEA